MQSLAPQFWWLGLLAIIPIALYLFRRRSKTVSVSTLVFFKSLAREHQESAWLRRLKRILSLILTLLLLLGGVSALSRIVFSPVTDDTRNVVILLDRSASMAATDKSGQTRMDVAKAQIQNRLAGLSEAVGVSLIVYDSRPHIVQPRTLKRRSLLAELDKIEVRPVSQNLDAALETARTLAKLETPAEVWHVTDDPAAADATALPEGVKLVQIPAGLENTTNVGFTAFQIRKLPLQSSRFTAFLQVACNEAAPEAVEGSIEVRVGGVFLPPRQFKLEPGERSGFEIPIDGATEQLLQLTLVAEKDCLPLDNSILVPLPETRPIVVARVAEKDKQDPFTQLALQALVKQGEVQIWGVEPDKWPMNDVDVAIFDGWLPDEWPNDIPAIVMNPPRQLGPIRAIPLTTGVPHDEIRPTNEDHPVLFRVSSSRLALTQTSVFDATGSFEPLWFAGAEPVLAAGAVGGQRIVVMGFAPQLSERLPLTASFPILLGNAIYWCAEGESTGDDRLQERRTGDVVNVSGKQMRWREVQDGKITGGAENLDRGLAELQRIGVWETDGGQRGTAHLLSRQETNILSNAAAADNNSAAAGGGWLLGDITWLILALIAMILVVESLLFHWFAVY
ncbi:MAG: hypothetical protein ACI8UO_000529 [Verrucomicrobiales bacterium]|jgi:hypothetical protein